MSTATANEEQVWCATTEKYFSDYSESTCQLRKGKAFRYDRAGLRKARIEHHRMKYNPLPVVSDDSQVIRNVPVTWIDEDAPEVLSLQDLLDQL